MKPLGIHIPGSKYIANRVLMISALTGSKSTISNVPENSDMKLLFKALHQMGIVVKRVGETEAGRYDVWGINSFRRSFNRIRRVDAGDSGTLLRFITGMACLLDGETEITADRRNMERPIEPLLKALKDLGVSVTHGYGAELYPLRIKEGLVGGRAVLPGDVSSQFISSLLIVSPYSNRDVELKVMKPVVSSAYIDITIREMKRFGVTAERVTGEEYDLFRVSAGQRYTSVEVDIPGDWSSANSLIAASVILGRGIKINRMDLRSNPGESEFVSILRKMGCRVNTESNSITVRPPEVLSGVEVDMKDSPDSVLTLIAVALFARGTTVVKSISHLIHKESNRIQQVENELRKTGAHIVTTEDSITVTGQKHLYPATTDSHNDHRLAMCLGLVKLRNRGMTVGNEECIRKSFPQFLEYVRMIDEEGEECLEIP